MSRGSGVPAGSAVASTLLSAISGPRARLAGPWITARGPISLEQPLIAGILNVTPDSFSDGGRFVEPTAALEHAAALVAAGAGMLDVGAESTRPGAARVSTEEEWRRLAPVLEEITRSFPDLPVSVDTTRARTAVRALDAGAWVINDVSGLRLDPELAPACAARGAGLILMHSRGSVAEMATYQHATYGDVADEVARELAHAQERAVAAGVAPESLVLDPGLGFSKTPEQSVTVLRQLPLIGVLGRPLMIGPSRKRFLGAITGRDVADRDGATAVACAMGYLLGASIFRVHAIAPVRDALAVAATLSAP